jgi:hypothetical protein
VQEGSKDIRELPNNRRTHLSSLSILSLLKPCTRCLWILLNLFSQEDACPSN